MSNQVTSSTSTTSSTAVELTLLSTLLRSSPSIPALLTVTLVTTPLRFQAPVASRRLPLWSRRSATYIRPCKTISWTISYILENQTHPPGSPAPAGSAAPPDSPPPIPASLAGRFNHIHTQQHMHHLGRVSSSSAVTRARSPIQPIVKQQGLQHKAHAMAAIGWDDWLLDRFPGGHPDGLYRRLCRCRRGARSWDAFLGLSLCRGLRLRFRPRASRQSSQAMPGLPRQWAARLRIKSLRRGVCCRAARLPARQHPVAIIRLTKLHGSLTLRIRNCCNQRPSRWAYERLGRQYRRPQVRHGLAPEGPGPATATHHALPQLTAPNPGPGNWRTGLRP